MNKYRKWNYIVITLQKYVGNNKYNDNYNDNEPIKSDTVLAEWEGFRNKKKST